MPEAPPVWKGTTALVEQGNSPQFSIGEKLTCRRVFKGKFSTCWSSIHFRGDLVTDIPSPSGTGVIDLWVSDCEVQPEKGGNATLVINYAGSLDGQTLPPDEESFTPQQSEVAIEKHPNWNAKFATANGLKAKVAIDKLIKLGPNDKQTDVEDNALVVGATADADFNFVYNLRLAGVHVYAVWPPTVQIVEYSFTPPATPSPGGYIETPPVADLNIPAGITYVRCGDDVKWNGTHYIRTMRWIAGPSVVEELYPTP
jgi:hypothetical protein